MAGRPHVRPDREYESNLGEVRVERGFTIKELAEACGVSTNLIHTLQSGMASPLSRRGELKPVVVLLCEILKVSPSDLFPRYICDLERSNGRILTNEQLNDFTLSRFSVVIRRDDIEVRLSVQRALMLLRPKEKMVICSLYGLDGKRPLTLEEIAIMTGTSRQRIDQIHAKAFRKLRHSSRLGGYEDDFKKEEKNKSEEGERVEGDV